MKRLSIMDTAFLMAENRETPMHVGGVHLFTLPDGADEQAFLHELAAGLRSDEQLQPPMGDKLKMTRLGLAGPVHWEPENSLDLDYHIRHSALPKPGRYRELFALASRLHGTLLDRNRPLWEMHLIEGLQDRQFAIYFKMHHAAVDGARAMHMTQSMYSENPELRTSGSVFSLEAQLRYREQLQANVADSYTDGELRNVAEAIKQTFDTGKHVFSSLRRLANGWMRRGGDLALPWVDVPRSSINTPVDGARRFVAQSWPFERLRSVAKALDGTFNDAVLAMCAGGLRAYMQNHSELPDKSLKAMVPVSLREKGDIDSGNAVGAISADLGTNIEDPIKRFQKIQGSMVAGKELFKGLKPKEAALMLQLLQAPGLLIFPLGLMSKFPPFSTVISNVPGPRNTMYWQGARLDGLYPASIVTEGLALNITLVSYSNQVDFGITACRRSMPQVQRLIDYMEESLTELEIAAGLNSKQPSTRAKTVKKRTTKKKVAKKARKKKTTKTKKVSAKTAKKKT